MGEAGLHRLTGKVLGVFLPVQPFLHDGEDDLSIHGQGGGALYAGIVDPKDVHLSNRPLLAFK